jgi:hypothetical protein
MNKYYLSAVIILFPILITTNLTAQSYFPENTPEWLVDMFFKQSQFPDKMEYLTGEMIEDAKFPTIGEELKGFADVTFRKIDKKVHSAAYAVDISGNSSKALFYCFLRNESGTWKIYAVRKFQLPKFIYTAVDSLERISNPKEFDQLLLGSLKLLTGSDEDLKSYLSGNINDFYKIMTAFENNDTNALNRVMDELNLEYVYVDKLYPGSVFIMLGSFGSIEVGFIYAKSGSVVPEISPNRFIYLEETLARWYVYRAM